MSLQTQFIIVFLLGVFISGTLVSFYEKILIGLVVKILFNNTTDKQKKEVNNNFKNKLKIKQDEYEKQSN